MIFGYFRLLIILAVVPGIFLLYQVYKLDRIEKEPIGLLIKLFFGSLISIAFAMIVEVAGGAILSGILPEYSVLYQVITYFIIVGLSEEFGKYFVMKKITWNHSEFDYRYDAIVYAVCVSMGFAVFENISYAMSFGMANTLVRAVTAIPAHCIFAIFMGHYYGSAKYYEGTSRESYYKTLALLVPVLLHGLYDFTATGEDGASAVAFLVIVVAMDYVAYKKIKQYAAEDQEIGY